MSRTNKSIAVFLCLSLFSFHALSQESTTHFAQFWNELTFTRPLKGKWALELNVGQTFTSQPDKGNPFYKSSQFYIRGWAHYYMNHRWKFSFSYGYYYNKDVPEINQRNYPELRSAMEALYFIKKASRYTLSARFRIEDRHIQNDSNYYEAVYRFREMIKAVVPFNSKFIREGVIYGILSDEVFFKTASNISGPTFFDRNRFTIGAGYSLTDNVQLELSYNNEILPRPTSTASYNAGRLNIIINNFLPDVKQVIKKL